MARVKKAEMEHRHQNMVPIEAFGMKANLDVVERYKRLELRKMLLEVMEAKLLHVRKVLGARSSR